MSWSLSALKHKLTDLLAFDLENDTVGSHYLFDENQEFLDFYDYGCDFEISEKYDLDYSDVKYTKEQWDDIFRKLIEKAKNISKELK